MDGLMFHFSHTPRHHEHMDTFHITVFKEKKDIFSLYPKEVSPHNEL